tara:strand:- start:43837 stop:44958 length:1122 start_codon:yes stop_codon:yes gene_type:complete
VKKIEIINLRELHKPIENELNQAMSLVLSHQNFINGPEVGLFESQLGNYLGAKVIGVGNGTDALEISLLALGIGAGDEVIVPSFSYFASAEAIINVGATPIFVDIDNSFTLDVHDFKQKISSKTKAVIVVHLFGMPANMNEIMKISSSHKIKVIEDNAQAIGAECKVNHEWKKTGTIGDIGCVSFFPSKNLGAFGDGGAIISADVKLLAKAKMIAQHGQSKKYKHELIGRNSRLDTIQAAILSVKLPYLDSWNQKRQEIASFYKESINEMDFVECGEENENSKSVYHQFTILVQEKRDRIMAKLLELEIPARLYYPGLIHQQAALSYLSVENLAQTQDIHSRMVSLPIHPTLTKNQLNYIIKGLKDAVYSEMN